MGEKLRLVVKEKVAPLMSFIYPAASALITNNKPTVKWKVTDNDSGVNVDSLSITFDSNPAITTGITKSKIDNGYELSYTPTEALSDGSHIIKIDSADNDGNKASQVTLEFTIDTVPPTLNVDSPANDLITNKNTVRITGVTNDATSSPVTLTVNDKVVTVNSDGTFALDYTLTVEGANTIIIKATDMAGKSTTITRTVTLDTKAPVIGEITLTPNPVDNGKTFIVSVNVTD